MSGRGTTTEHWALSTEHFVVDAHVHAFWPDVVSRRELYLTRDRWFRDLYAAPRARLATAEDLLVSMGIAGIAQSVVCGFPWRDLGLCREHNDYLAEVSRESDGRLAWLAVVPPGGAVSVYEAERAFSLGAVGLGELNADAQGFELDHPSEAENGLRVEKVATGDTNQPRRPQPLSGVLLGANGFE